MKQTNWKGAYLLKDELSDEEIKHLEKYPNTKRVTLDELFLVKRRSERAVSMYKL